MCAEPTFEGLCLQPPKASRVSIFAAEGGLFVGGYGMANVRRCARRPDFSALWDGDPFPRVRANDGAPFWPVGALPCT